MAAKSILVLCASACFFKIVSAQCIGAQNGIAGSALLADELAFGHGAGFNGYGPLGYGAAVTGYGPSVAPSSGGGFAVTSVSPISPTGISVVSENAIEGPLSITGQLPFLGAIALEGALPSAGAGGINYGCGNGAVGIISEGVAPALGAAAYPAGAGIGPGGMTGGLGYPGFPGARPYNGLGAGLGRGVY